ncbi:MAG: ADP-ribosylglycohydrolase family protein [Duodenibacillus sp.]
MPDLRHNRRIARALLLGAAVGDALGVPFEFRERGTFLASGMTGFGTYDRPAGTWSDDTSLTLALADAICNGSADVNKAARNCVDWLFAGQWTADGVVFDVGNGTRRAVERLANGCPPEEAGNTDVYSNGNGSLMRIAPLVVCLDHLEQPQRFALVECVSSLTHRHPVSIIGCILWCEMLLAVARGKSPAHAYGAVLALQSVLVERFGEDPVLAYRRFFEGGIGSLAENDILSDGYVVHTLEAALFCLLTTHNYREAVEKAVNLGSDTDTTACVTGAMAALWYGVESIPADWLGVLRGRERIEATAEKMTA